MLADPVSALWMTPRECAACGWRSRVCRGFVLFCAGAVRPVRRSSGLCGAVRVCGPSGASSAWRSPAGPSAAF